MHIESGRNGNDAHMHGSNVFIATTADWLADCGQKRARPSLREAERWLADWIDTQQRAALHAQRRDSRGDG